jgi:hypothetical protein
VEGSEPPSTEKRLSSTEPKRIPLFAKDGEATRECPRFVKKRAD